MNERDVVWSSRGRTTDGPRVGLASYESSDPEATFEIIEPSRPQLAPRAPGLGTWLLRGLLVWAVNFVALLAAGLVVTAVGGTDPLQYVAWAVVFGLVNAALPLSARLLRRLPKVLAVGADLLVVDVLLIWLMTVVARPFHSPDLPAIAKAGAVMWAANVPLLVLFLGRGDQAVARPPA